MNKLISGEIFSNVYENLLKPLSVTKTISPEFKDKSIGSGLSNCLNEMTRLVPVAAETLTEQAAPTPQEMVEMAAQAAQVEEVA